MKIRTTTAWWMGVLLVLATGPSGLAQDDPKQDLEKLSKELERLLEAQEKYKKTLDEIRTEFDKYRAARDAEVDRLSRSVAEQAERATAALDRARQVELELEGQRARLELARRRVHDLQDTATTLAEEVKQANAVNAENRAWLERMTKRTGETSATDYLVRLYLPNAIENYRARFHRVPPMSVRELNITSRYQGLRIEKNTLNECSEALVVALRNPDFPAPLRDRFLPTKPPFGNTDADSWNRVPDGGSGLDAVELVDAWGHPIVYIHKNQYKEAVRVVNAKGVEVKVVALFGPDGVFYNPTSYQIFSLGPNGVQEVETKKLKDSDDLRNFELKIE